MSDIEQTQREIVEELSEADNWQDRYRKIIALGKALPEIEERHKVEENLVKGCQNRVWLHASLDDEGKVIYEADSEAMIVRGLVALLLRSYSGFTPDEIVETPPRFIEALNFGENISLNRSNGLAAMVKKMKLYAVAFKSMSAS